MARVDPGDDSITRYIVHHYRYDPGRRERRYVVVAAFDDEREFRACLSETGDEIARRREAGLPVHPSEQVSGIVYEPGYLRRAANGHLLKRALRHGVSLDRLAGLELPASIVFLSLQGGSGGEGG